MRYCKKCVQPDTRPGIYFDERGICGACLYEEEKKTIDWDARAKELRDIVESAKKNTKIPYDCAIGVSGGKDSTFQALYVRDVLGLRPLLVNSEPEGITDIGKHNIENLISAGFDIIKMRPNPKIIQKMIKRDFYKHMNPVKITEYSLWSSTYIIAHNFNVPLIIQGENAGLTLGVSKSGVGTDGDALNANKGNTLSEDWRSYLTDEISERDLFFYHYDRDLLSKNKIRGIWLQYYLKEWSQSHNAEFSMKHGLKIKTGFNPEDIGSYVGYFQLDSDLVQIGQVLKHVKFGFGQCTDHACYDIRDGRITREEGIELVKKYDGKISDKYVSNFCDYIDITVDEFWQEADKWRGPMWEKDPKGEWSLKDPIWEQEKCCK
ncbi:MAG: N-acetyl sugar amidotransferase [Candidatus Omnitrophica bacterium]|nr:N-acetyl sugar amidotransferase [Candidatus Omnitrophota bacterium]